MLVVAIWWKRECFEYLYCLACFCCCDFYMLYVSLGSRVSPSIFGLMFMGSVMLSICSSSCVLYSAGSGVKCMLSCLDRG